MLPTNTQIEAIAEKMAANLGSGVHVYAGALLESVDMHHGPFSDCEINTIKNTCAAVSEKIRATALRRIWW